MNHEEAIRNQVAAAYLLGDLPDAERDAFEEHYFDCVVCGDTVRNGAKLFATGAHVVTLEPAYQRFRPWKWVASSAAATALTMVVGYQAVVLPRLAPAVPAIAVLREVAVPAGESRNAGSQEARLPSNQASALRVDLTADQLDGYPRYQFQLTDAAGEQIALDDIRPDVIDEARAGNSISFGVRPLPAGRYVLQIIGVPVGGNREMVYRCSVVVE